MADLITLAEVHQFLEITTSDTEHDTLFGDLIAYYTQFIEEYCQKKFTQASFTEYISGGVQDLIIKNRPITSITSITDTDDDSVQSADDYDFDPEGGLIYLSESNTLFVYGTSTPKRRPMIWPSGRRRWKVVYVGGVDGAPDDVKLACLGLVTARYNLRDAAMKSERIGDYSYQVETVNNLPPETKMILDKYREITI